MKMFAGDEVKQILYAVIEDIGKEKIQADITSSIESSQKYIDIIMRNCIKKLSSESNDDYYATIAISCEALLHFMLTICPIYLQKEKSKLKTI